MFNKKYFERLLNSLSAGCDFYLEGWSEDFGQFSLNLLSHIDGERIPVQFGVVDAMVTSLSGSLLVIKDPLFHKIIKEEYD